MDNNPSNLFKWETEEEQTNNKHMMKEGETEVKRLGKGVVAKHVRELHNVMERVWDIWKEIAVDIHLVCVSHQSRNQKRKNMRLVVSIMADRKEKSIGKEEGKSI
ncbi:MAG: hypothetical protein LBB16_00980 [Puniceicoccales bacterium]|jgi:hypothetical protein|nr:hypothetical protein [Puniceicoccales bacterium]